jgi:hypothetical protein
MNPGSIARNIGAKSVEHRVERMMRRRTDFMGAVFMFKERFAKRSGGLQRVKIFYTAEVG